MKPGNPWREGGKRGGRDEREGGDERTDGRDGWDVVAIMKWVHMAWNGCIIGNRAKPGNQLVYSCGSAI